MAERGALALGRSPTWLKTTARRVHAMFPDPPRDRFGETVTAIANDAAFEKALSDRREVVRVRRYFLPEPAMRAGRPDWDVPPLATMGDCRHLGRRRDRRACLARGLAWPFRVTTATRACAITSPNGCPSG